jgi:hypothetical protein
LESQWLARRLALSFSTQTFAIAGVTRLVQKKDSGIGGAIIGNVSRFECGVMVAPKTDQTDEGKTAGQAGKGAPAPSFADVAREITGDDAPPDWLVEGLAQWAPSLTIDRALALRQPGRSKMKKSCKMSRPQLSSL